MALHPVPIVGIPAAGSLHDDLGNLVSLLVIRMGDLAIDQTGRLIYLDRPSEWPDRDFSAWRVINLDSWKVRFNPGAMADACWAVEKMTFSADRSINRWNIRQVMHTAATMVLITAPQPDPAWPNEAHQEAA